MSHTENTTPPVHGETSKVPPSLENSTLPYTVPTSTQRLSIIAWASIVMGSLSVLMLIAGEMESEEDVAMGIFSVLFFGGLGGWLKLKLAKFDKAFEATEDGLTVHSQYGVMGPIRWDEIREFRIVKTRYKFLALKSIGVELQDPKQTASRLGKFARLSSFASEFMDTTPLGVPTMIIAPSHFEVLDRLNAILKQQTSRT